MRRGKTSAAQNTESPLLVRLRYEESGADMIEYALIATLITLAAIATVGGVGTKIASYYSSITSSF
ncbi:MAG: Flp family type IVb pilin [Acidobacteriaceae bacterium]